MAAKLRSQTSWRTKLERVTTASVVDMPARWIERFGPGKVVIPRPLDVDAMIRRVGHGDVITVPELRRKLADGHGVEIACPLTTGIFIRIAAETAEEDRALGRQDVTPYWRVLSAEGRLNPKFPGGVSCQAERLRAEGHEIEPGAGKRAPRVIGWERRLARL